MRRGLTVVTASLCLHGALIGAVPAVMGPPSQARLPVEVVLDTFLDAPAPPPVDGRTKDPAEGLGGGVEPAPEGPGRGPGQLTGSTSRTGSAARAYTEAMADAARALGAASPSPFVIEEGMDLEAPVALMGGSLGGLEQLGHAPGLGCTVGSPCGDHGRPLAPTIRAHAPTLASTAPCHGLHVCPRPRLPPPLHVEVVVRGALEPVARSAVRTLVRRAGLRCVPEAGPRHLYAFALTVGADGAVRTVQKLDPSLEGTARQTCLAAALARLALPAAGGDSAILARIWLR